MVKKLIQAGGEVNELDVSGMTPLHKASVFGHVEVITALLAAGADKTIQAGQRYETPYDVAMNQECKNALK